MKLIGKGKFTRCYLNDGVTVTLKSTCSVKECRSLGWFPEHRLFPPIEREDSFVYTMEYIPKVKSLKGSLEPREYQLYKELVKLFKLAIYPPKCHPIDVTRELLSELPDEYSDEREALLEAVDAMTNYGDKVYFECSPRNVGVKEGKLLLLDVFHMGDDKPLKDVRDLG
jgi:hypothetical protein